MRHPFQVSIVAAGVTVIVAKRSTIERAIEQAQALKTAIGNYNRDGIPAVKIVDLRRAPAVPPPVVIPENDVMDDAAEFMDEEDNG